MKGRVQGVWFRDSTRQQARALGIKGHAINLPNGDVEVLAIGEREAISSLAQWLQTGPPLARVSEVIQDDAEASEAADFTIG